MSTPTRAPHLGLIWAQARGGVIGQGGTMPWHLPEDLAHFKRTTDGQPVIMGRRTWDSLPERFRPLPGRDNIVLTRQPDWHAPGARSAPNLAAALAWCASAPRAWVIGGAQTYAQALPLADTLVITHIHADFDGDTFAPDPGPDWEESQRQALTSASGLALEIVSYRRPAGFLAHMGSTPSQ